jgi:hypothetical protein
MEQLRPEADLLRRGLLYWKGLCRGRPLPLSADFDPLGIQALLPYVMLIEIERAPLDFRFWLMGSRHAEIVRGDYRGTRYSALSHTARGNPVWDQHERAARAGTPVLGHVSYVGPDPKVPRRIEHCLLPLSLTGERADYLMVIAAIDGARAQPGA